MSEDLRDVPSRGDQAVDRAEYIRLLEEKLTAAQNARDSALDHEHTTSCGHKWTMRHTACPECFAALRQRVEELEQTQARMVKCGDDLHDALSAAEAEVERYRYTSDAQSVAWKDRALKNEAEVARLRSELAGVANTRVNWQAALAEVEGLRAALVDAHETGIRSVTMIRCIKHREVPQYNRSEGDGAECAACEAEALRETAGEILRAHADTVREREEALKSIAASTCCDSCQEAARVARAALRGGGE